MNKPIDNAVEIRKGEELDKQKLLVFFKKVALKTPKRGNEQQDYKQTQRPVRF